MSSNLDKPKIHQKLTSFFRKCVRVWNVLKKPTKQEVFTIAKVSAIGILVIGLVGFLISLIMRYIVPR